MVKEWMLADYPRNRSTDHGGRFPRQDLCSRICVNPDMNFGKIFSTLYSATVFLLRVDIAGNAAGSLRIASIAPPMAAPKTTGRSRPFSPCLTTSPQFDDAITGSPHA